MTITTWPIQERPREKLLTKGANTLSDAELLAIFLRTGIKGKTAVDLARQLLSDFGGLRSLLETHQDTFCQQPGMGSAKFAQIQAAMEISRRHLLETLKRQNIFTNVEEAHQYLTAQLRHYDHEVFACLFLDNQHRLISYEELFHGSIHSANVYPREVVKKALHFNACAVILAHNHPSGQIKPSAADKQVTSILKKALELVDIRVLDHVIIGEGECASFAQLGLL